MEQQTVYLVSPLFTPQNPLNCGSKLNLLDKESGEPVTLPAGYAISEVCVQRSSVDELSGSPTSSKVYIGTFDNEGATSCEYYVNQLNSDEVAYICHRPKPMRASTSDLYLQVEASGCSCNLTQGQLYIVIKYVCIAMGPQASKRTPRQPILYKIKNSPFGAPSGNL